MKIRELGAEFFNADRQTDRQTDIHDEAKSWFSQFCELRLKVVEIRNFTFDEAYIA